MAEARTDPYPSSAGHWNRWCSATARHLTLQGLANLREGCLELRTSAGTELFGDPASGLRAVVQIHDARTFQWGALRGEVGLGEAYVAGWWSSPDPVAVARLAVRNMAAFDGGPGPLTWLAKTVTRLRHLRRRNTRAGAQSNIAAHYDLGNDFYQLWLDPSMAYSCAIFPRAEATLEEAQTTKYERICEQLRLSPEDHLLEIGTGWGGFARYAARTRNCRVTSTTISREQQAFAVQQIQEAGLADRVSILLKDYRDLQGSFDKAVAIEMFEAVGLRFYDAYFAQVDRLLKPDGAFLLQTITMNERRFPDYIRSTDWIQQYVFPGAELSSLLEIQKSLARATDLGVFFVEDLGPHYARTLAAWRHRFHVRSEEVSALGFDASFQRLWDWYLASCEGAFRERYIGVAQLLLAKRNSQRPLLREPWSAP